MLSGTSEHHQNEPFVFVCFLDTPPEFVFSEFAATTNFRPIYKKKYAKMRLCAKHVKFPAALRTGWVNFPTAVRGLGGSWPTALQKEEGPSDPPTLPTEPC